MNKQNHLGGADITSSAYDFANRATHTRRDHTATPPGGTLKTYAIREEYIYDDAGRLRFTRHKINSNNWTVTAAPVYDELNRLADKRLHASNYDGVSAITVNSAFNYLQSLDYAYNIRGWLTAMNAPSSCSVQGGDQLADLFSMSLDYESTANGASPQYNGNIASMQWRTNISGGCQTQQQYRFSYDYANRLTAANHYTHNGTAWANTNNYSESGIIYDLNGNIKNYTRRGLLSPGVYGVIDQLTYTYGDALRPDRLTQMADAGSATKGFVYTAAAAAYQYDLNGNMTLDNHKGFTLAYNYLNLPQSFAKGANVITITYTADGEKLSKALTGGGATKNYVSGIEYSGANLEAIYFSEGRCTPNGATAFYYDYTIKDHLGNARLNFRANGASVTFLEDLHYYPFGMLQEGLGASSPANDYSYNYKELNEDFGLNLHDYGARWYDAALGRWWGVDPMALSNGNVSPYQYVMNRPVSLIDLTGMDDEEPEGADGLTNSQWIQSSRPGGSWAKGDAKKFKEENEDRRRKKEEEEKNKTKVEITVTDEVVGTGNVYADGQSGTDFYFEVNIYRMIVSYTDKDGESISGDFEVLKYGVKYDAKSDSYYYQAFGGGTSSEEITINNPTFDSHYKYGGFNLFGGGLYDLHPQHSSIRSAPGAIGGRVNKGCIGVCGSGSAGWGGVTDMLFAAAGMSNQVGISQKDKKAHLAKMLSQIDLTITIHTFSVPVGTPSPIKK